MGSYLLKADGERFDAWRAAQVRLGFPSLAAFIRAAGDALAGGSMPVVVKREWDGANATNPVLTPETHTGVVGRTFSPDFGKRLKP